MSNKISDKVSVAQLAPADKEGFLTKQGGSYKTWKRRWFVLKGQNLYYFKTKKDVEHTGVIVLTKESFVKREPSAKKKNCFAVGTVSRVFFMFPDVDKPSDTESWIQALQAVIQSLSPSVVISDVNEIKHIEKIQRDPHPDSKQKDPDAQARNSTGGDVDDAPLPDGGARGQLRAAKDCIPFLRGDTQVLEFWEIWMESIPPRDQLVENSMVFEVATSACMEKLTWRSFGPQNVFIQRMVDFFWNVGAPETEIDRLNDIGALINPVSIGSWIDMSEKGGMDGGWFFPVDVPMKFALEAGDEGDPVTKLSDWAQRHNIVRCEYVGRDMGAAPPRQTEVQFQLNGDNPQQQLDVALTAYTDFGIPPPPENALQLLRANFSHIGSLSISVITSSEGFVRLGLLIPRPPLAMTMDLCACVGANSVNISEFQRALCVEGPEWAELQFLNPGFGYGVYREGFDVVFHYHAGSELPPQ
eukprot:TRINITY_DN1934_c0_g1_i7.p1 TRINITY_DN1934_c0_g1~~TRINITY_DN1934_c0_g1_i7.p1  ORF type:complete len:471 (-),score=100.78 TRINITY_DN1934_c0_g1_i7:221-1633(-)